MRVHTTRATHTPQAQRCRGADPMGLPAGPLSPWDILPARPPPGPQDGSPEFAFVSWKSFPARRLGQEEGFALSSAASRPPQGLDRRSHALHRHTALVSNALFIHIHITYTHRYLSKLIFAHDILKASFGLNSAPLPGEEVPFPCLIPIT